MPYTSRRPADGCREGRRCVSGAPVGRMESVAPHV